VRELARRLQDAANIRVARNDAVELIYNGKAVEPRPNFWVVGLIGIGAAVAHRPLPHHRAYGSVHGGSSWLR
jgi:hypothetical protein